MTYSTRHAQATIAENQKADISLDQHRRQRNLRCSNRYRFSDYMLEQLSRHSLMDLMVRAKGDLHIDNHHTTEDTGIAIGEAINKAMSDRRGIVRYSSVTIPMDETLTRVSIDVSNRPYLVWKVNFSKPKLGEMDTELFKEWFQAFAQNARVTLHVENLYGENNHHIVESCFKALARPSALLRKPTHALEIRCLYKRNRAADR